MKSKSTTTKKRTKAVQLASLRYVRTVKMGERWNTYLQIDRTRSRMTTSALDSAPQTGVPAGGHYVHRLVRHLDLFSGIGGFALAARMVGGIETIAFSEIEPYANSILKRHWPDVPNLGDIRNVRGIKCDLITGGFPCQPFSIAGKRRAENDPRHLWPEMRRVISESRPTWVLGENVPHIANLVLGEVCADLEAEGYEVQPLDIPACAVGGGHLRQRTWLLAHLADGGQEKDGAETAIQAGQRNQRPESSGELPGGLGRLDWRPAMPAVVRDVDGIPNRTHRIHALGNAIVPQVAAEILRCMMRVDCLANASGEPHGPNT